MHAMPHRKLIARLQAFSGLAAEDRARLEDMPHTLKVLADGDYVARQGDRPQSCAIVVSGFLARQRVISTRNQISAFYVPGDMPDLHTLHVPVLDHDLCSIGPSTVALVPHLYLGQTLAKSATLTAAFWRETLIQSVIHREWIDNLAARQALPRLAHLVCELAARLDIVGLVKDGRFELPMSQEDLADACGLSNVHVNRTIQELRRRELIDWSGRMVEVLQPDQLERLAEFSAAYLQLLKTPVAR
ncbi:cAMP-binding domain of CRP or a regulatory subunit of cAMP-dependent protein kinases [Bradyrhizobium sp. Gha]|nr:cAMP-binding domain of CRP or a regulatory subunit of cAMP-dependent protein kinases [Bradyrhizobium sp. Gha]